MAMYSNIARPYANAVFAYAKEHGLLEVWLDILNQMSTLVAVPEIQQLLKRPGLEPAVVVSIIESCLPQVTEASVKHFLTLLADHRRLVALPAIKDLYLNLYHQEKKQTTVSVRSAFPLSSKIADRLKRVLEKQLDAQVILEVVVDSALIGGAIITAEEYVIDGSIQGKLKQLSQALS
jgi:F-type H+-transporting ATPase subunit delta